jgi:hypothetical protein
VCQQTGPTQAIPAEALTAEKAKMPAPNAAPARDLLSAVIFNPPFMFFDANLTAQLDLGSPKTGHCQLQIRPLGVETGQYRLSDGRTPGSAPKPAGSSALGQSLRIN